MNVQSVCTGGVRAQSMSTLWKKRVKAVNPVYLVLDGNAPYLFECSMDIAST